MLRIEYITDKSDWNNALQKLPNPHFLQTYEWGELKDLYNWESKKVALYRDETIVAVVLLLKKRLPLLKSSIIYCPRGPIFDFLDSSLIPEILSTLKVIAKKESAVSIKIDSEQLYSNAQWKSALKDNGWKKSSEVQFRNTAVIDLTPNEDELLAKMKKKGRYNIKIAQKKGVTTKISDREGLVYFFDQYTNTGKRNNFITRSKDYYMTVANKFIESGNGTLFTAHHEDDFLAGAFIVVLKDTAWYFYGSSSNHKRNLMPTYLLHWEIIKWAKKKGLKSYDMWGAPEILNERDSMWGVYKFKENLGASFREQAGAYDLTIKPLSSIFVNRLIPLIQNIKKAVKG